MKKLFLLANLLIISTLTFAQSILAGSETFDKIRKDGFYITMNINKKYIEKDWSAYISKFGGVQNKKDDYLIANANMQSISPDPVALSSKLTGDKSKTTVFCAFDLGNGNLVAGNSKGFDGVQKLLQDFNALAMANEDVRNAEADLNAAQESSDKVVKTGDKIARNIESNKKDHDRLLKKLEDNKNELDQLTKDQAANVQDQQNAKLTLEEKRKNVDAVRAKIPK